MFDVSIRSPLRLRQGLRLASVFGLLGATALAQAEIYRIVDAQGRVTFSDQRGSDADQLVTLRRINEIQAPRPSTPPASATDPVADTDTLGQVLHYDRLRLLGIEGDVVRANNGNLGLTLDIAPELATTHRLQLLLDGAPQGAPAREPRFELINVDRGEHRVAVRVLDGDRELQRSEDIHFTLLRPSVGPRSTP